MWRGRGATAAAGELIARAMLLLSRRVSRDRALAAPCVGVRLRAAAGTPWQPRWGSRSAIEKESASSGQVYVVVFAFRLMVLAVESPTICLCV